MDSASLNSSDQKKSENKCINYDDNLIRQRSTDDTFEVIRNSGVGSADAFHDDHITSQYYGSSGEVGICPQTYHMQKGQKQSKDENKATQQSRRLPPWVWFLITKILGLKKSANDRPIIGLLLHVLTVTSASVYTVTYVWYKIYDIINHSTNERLLNGSVLIVICIFWCAIGIYANQLARKLFHNVNFVDSIRLHSKTIAKINTALLMCILATVAIGLNLWKTSDMMVDEFCSNVDIHEAVCKLMFVSKSIFALFSLVWNLLVGIILLSTCRTHTIGVRRFIRQLLEDAKHYEYSQDKKHLKMGMKKSILSDDLDLWSPNSFYESIEDFRNEIYQEDYDGPLNNRVISDTVNRSNENCAAFSSQDEVILRVQNFKNNECNNPSINNVKSNEENTFDYSKLSEEDEPLKQPSVMIREDDSQQAYEMKLSKKNFKDSVKDNVPIEDEYRKLTNDQILLSFWKIGCRLRVTSSALQRWLVCWVMLIIIWSITYIIYWLKHAATFVGIAEFILPILLLPLVCSAYGEVNYEGRRVIRCLMPTEDRVQMLYYMAQNPLELNAFNFPVTYGSISTALGAIGLAFISRLILDEISI